MAEAARARQQGACPDLPDDVMHDIFLRLPPRTVLRCRVVCKAWRRITSDSGFLLAHHRRQPSLPLVYSIGGAGYDRETGDYRLAAFDLRAGELRTVVGFSGHGNLLVTRDSRFTLHGSCDGVLLLSSSDCLFLCNPATRRWARLPPVHLNGTIVGLYSHTLSGEYRMLYFRQRHGDGCCCSHFVMSAGSSEERLVGRQVSPLHTSWHTWLEGHTAPVLLHGNLHWAPISPRQDHITVFDTVAEVFRSMRRPAYDTNNNLGLNVKLLDMEGVLALSCSWSETVLDAGPSRVDLWLLEDYNVWVCKYRIELPVEEISRFRGLLDMWSAVVVSQEGDVLVDLMHRLLRYDKEGNLVANLPCDCSLLDIGVHMLKESLVPHASLWIEDYSSHKDLSHLFSCVRFSDSNVC